MNKKALSFIKNFSYTASSNLISMMISTTVILIVPKFIGIESYGYWQLYLFYSSYVGFLHFGWNDGVYLRYGGKKYKELNKELFFSQFWMLVIFQILIGVVFVVFSTVFSADPNKELIFKLTAVCMLIVNVRLMIIYILQSTNKIKEYALVTMMERVLYCSLILLFLFVGFRQYKLLILSDILGKLVSLIYAIYCCRDIIFNKLSHFHFYLRETFENINVGIKLMFANIAGMLIIGIVRLGIEHTWDVSTFGKVSLTLSVSNLLLVFINAVGIVMFPILRRTSDKKLSKIYRTIRIFLSILLLGLLGVYYPLNVILSAWLPQYIESLKYMALLFPMCVFEGKMALLINTYLKTLRKEKLILFINLVSVVLSIFFTLLFTIAFKNLPLAVVSIVLLLAFRCTLAEVLLTKIFNVSVYKDILLEIVLTLIFILTAWFMTSWIGVVIYFVTFGLYLVIKRREIKVSIGEIIQIAKG